MSAIVEINKIAKEAQKIVNAQRSHSSSEIKKVPDNWADFVRLLKIRSGERYVQFEPYDFQIQLDEVFESHHTILGVKSRQMAWTTYGLSKGLHRALKNRAYVGLFFSQKQETSSLLAHRVKEMAQSIPEYAQHVNNTSLVQRFKDGGTLLFCNPSPNGLRGVDSCSDLFIDEAAFIDSIELLWGQIKNTQSYATNPKTLIISTPNTVTDWYYEKLTKTTPEIVNIIQQVRKGELDPFQVITDKNGWAKVICHWKAHPIYSKIPNFLEYCAEKDQIPIEQVYQERDLSFEDNVMNVFSLNLVNQCFTLEKDEEINENAEYYFGIDTAGAGNDYFVCVILKVIDGKIYLVDYYRNRTNPTPVHVDRISQLINKYKPYRVSIETNAGGQQYYDLIKDAFPSLDLNAVNTNQNSKANMITKLLYLMELQDFLGLNQQVIRDEFLSYQKVGEKYGAIEGKHDDIVMSTAIGCSGIRFYK